MSQAKVKSYLIIAVIAGLTVAGLNRTQQGQRFLRG